MKIFLQFIGLTFGAFFLTCCVLALAGCEWTAGGGVNSWQETAIGSNSVDFSGSYKAADGNVLVRQFGAGTAPTTNTASDELLATGDGSKTAFSGQTAYTPVRGSLTIFTIGGYRFTDTAGTTADTVSLVVTPADGSTGTFNYSTRAWALTFPAPLASGTQILGTYRYAIVTPIQGNHGKAIYSFIVYQMGNKLQVTDSNGATYEGTLGYRTVNDSEAQFNVTGVSQGYNVTMVGVLQGNTMKATYIEEGGYEADVNAVRQ